LLCIWLVFLFFASYWKWRYWCWIWFRWCLTMVCVFLFLMLEDLELCCVIFGRMRGMERGDAWYNKYGDLETMEGKKTKLSFFFRCFVLFCFPWVYWDQGKAIRIPWWIIGDEYPYCHELLTLSLKFCISIAPWTSKKEM
jgi:hypothetical protein